MTEATVQIFSNELLLLWESDQFLREKCFYLERSGIGCKKYQRVYPEQFLTNFQFLEEF